MTKLPGKQTQGIADPAARSVRGDDLQVIKVAHSMRGIRRLWFEAIELRRLLAAVNIPDDLAGAPQQQVSSPLTIDNASGVRGVEIHLRYDPTVLEINTSQIVLGSLWANDSSAEVVANIDASTGTIVVFIFAAEGLSAASGSLVNFNFTVLANALPGSTTVLDLTQVRLNEGAIDVTPAPQVGSDPTDGLITISADEPQQNGSISGIVFADVNLNNAPDATEGLPGVLITLINTATNAQVQATTTSDGQYQFTNLAPGSYVIQQKQPAAFINGGPNEISITLGSGQILTDQNFRELGLRPEFVYNRLFTTIVMPVGSTAWTTTVEQIISDAENGIVRAIQITPPPTTMDTSSAPTSTPLVNSQTDTNSFPALSAGEAIAPPAPPTASQTAAVAFSAGEATTEPESAELPYQTSELVVSPMLTVEDGTPATDDGFSFYTLSSTEQSVETTDTDAIISAGDWSSDHAELDDELLLTLQSSEEFGQSGGEPVAPFSQEEFVAFDYELWASEEL